jgi:hypothetical protein
MPEETAPGTLTDNGHDHVSFSDLVRAHFEWDQANSNERRSGDDRRSGAERRRFHEVLDHFESEAGKIVDAYWCRTEASGVALTRRERERPGRFRPRRKLEYRLHRVSDWVTGETHEIADLLHDCDILAIKAANTLEGIQRSVVMQWLLLVESHLLGFIERHRNKPPRSSEVRTFAAAERAELQRIETYYMAAGEKRGRMRYVEGMLFFGVLLVIAAAFATAGALWLFGAFDAFDDGVRDFYASAAAGALGAIVSVMLRMSGRGSFSIDHEMGRWEVVLLGAYRPVIGSVCGIIAYFLIQTPFIPIELTPDQELPVYVSVAFIAGFSERWMRTMLDGAMHTIAPGDDDEKEASDKKAETPPATEPTPVGPH